MDQRTLCRRRAHAHGFGRPAGSVAATAAHCVGLQAQDTTAARLQVRARGGARTATEVSAACDAAHRQVVRTWLMRGTLHLVAADDVRWLLGVFGDRNAAKTAGRRAQLGLTADVCARALDALPDVLGDAALSRADVVAGLRARGVDVDPTGQAPAHLVLYAAARGVVCRGPDLARDEPGYVLLDAWLPAAGHRPDDPVQELARRYLVAYAPAGPQDFAAWSGLPLGMAKRAFEGLGEGPADARESDAVRLLGAYDTYLLGYRDRSAVLDPGLARRVASGAGIIHPAVLSQGRLVGTWRVERPRRVADRASVAVELFPGESVDGDALDAERADVLRFLGR